MYVFVCEVLENPAILFSGHTSCVMSVRQIMERPKLVKSCQVLRSVVVGCHLVEGMSSTLVYNLMKRD